MSLFSRLDRIASRAVDRTHSVKFWLMPMTGGPNSRKSPDAQRDQVEGRGVLDEERADAPIETENRDRAGNDFRTIAGGGLRTVLSVDVHRCPEITKAKQGDRVSLDDARVFEVVSVQPNGLARVELVLNRR